jgi:hypothetical protein
MKANISQCLVGVLGSGAKTGWLQFWSKLSLYPYKELPDVLVEERRSSVGYTLAVEVEARHVVASSKNFNV